MNNRVALISVAPIFIALLFPACSIRKEPDAVVERMEKEHQACLNDIENRLAEYGTRLEELYDRAATSAGDGRDEIYDTIDAVKRKQKAVAKKYDELKSASRKTWKNMQRRIERSVNDMEETYDKALALYHEIK